MIYSRQPDFEGMYWDMAAKIGNVVRCETCKREEVVDAARCLRTGWPRCCGHTMSLLDKKKERR